MLTDTENPSHLSVIIQTGENRFCEFTDITNEEVNFIKVIPIDYYPHRYFPKIALLFINEIVLETQAPISLISGSVLAAMALAVQAKFRVKRREGLESPCSLAIVSICASGERKTTVDKITTKAFRDFESDQIEEYERKLTEHKAKKKIWTTQQQVFQRKLKKALENDENTEKIQSNLIAHEYTEPKAPRCVRLLYNDVTSAALLHGLYTNTRSAALNEDEGARFFEGRLINDAALINKGWDGSSLTIDRQKTGRISIESPRITLNLMVQPQVFSKYMERKGEDARGVGFIARWLVSRPISTQGSRQIKNSIVGKYYQHKFNCYIKELLEHQLSIGSMENDQAETVLTFSPEAEHEWVSIANMIEGEIKPGGFFWDARDYASKVAENIARIAGIFHVFKKDKGTKISLNTLRSAVEVAKWYANEFINLFSPTEPINQLYQDAEILDNWLIKIVRERNDFHIDKNEILQKGPNSLRKVDKLNNVLSYLGNLGRIHFYNRSTHKLIISLHYEYYHPVANGHQPKMGFPKIGQYNY